MNEKKMKKYWCKKNASPQFVKVWTNLQSSREGPCKINIRVSNTDIGKKKIFKSSALK